ncbi:hypothetical protein G9A89_019769 [Geosiphon pyriformis]|nr:hypothetical protein G9A89_019769 [Geosiphon pyriformis]
MTAYIAKIPKFNGEDIETSPQEWLDQEQQANDQFIAGLKDKLIKKVRPHAPKDLNSAIQHAKRYEMAMEEANCTKLVNLAIGETSSAAEKKIDQLTKKDFHHTALLKARIAENTNLSDIFSFEFKANKSPFLLSNAAANEQKAITAMYTEAEVKGKAICLILDSGSTRIIITYQLMQQLKRNVDRPAQTVIITANGIKKTPVREIDNFPFTLDGITISVKVLVMDVPQYQALTGKPKNYNSLIKDNMPKYLLLVEEEKPVVETFMALESTFNWAEETEQMYFATNSYPEEPKTPRWDIPYSKPEPKKQHPYIPLKCKDCYKKLSSMGVCILPEKKYRKVENRMEHPVLLVESSFLTNVIRLTLPLEEESVKCETSFNTTYNSTLNKLYYYPYNAKIIYKLAMILINRGTKEDVFQIKEAEYIEYTLKLAGFDYKDEIECSECYALSISLPSKNDEYKIEFGEPEATEKIETTSIYLIENQPASQLKYFNNNKQGIKLEKAHEIDVGYDLRYPGKDTLTLKPKLLTKINLKIALKIPPRTIIQIAL